mgnify:FL=1
MTTEELIQKLEECRSSLEGHDDDMVNSTFWTLNEIISNIENDGLESSTTSNV